MTWLHKPMLRRILMGAAAAFCLALPVQAEGIWSEYAFISSTLGVSDSRICIGEASRGDIGCPSFAPTISPTGRLNASAGLTVDTVSLTTGGTTWGYLGSGSSYLPNLNTNNISLTTINGVSISALGGGASPTNVPAFSVHKNNVGQTIPATTFTTVTFSTKTFDTLSNFNTGNSRFTPAVAGNYLFIGSVYCPSSNSCYALIRKNGTISANQTGLVSSGQGIVATASIILPMNGTTDYVELQVYSANTTISGNPAHTSFSGSLLASGNGLISGTGVTALSALTDVALSSPATGQVLTYNGTSWVNATPSATTVISGTTSMVEGWPDALVCRSNDNSHYLVFHNVAGYFAGLRMYRLIQDASSGTEYAIRFNSDATYNSAINGSGYIDSCLNKPISQLYAEGRAFNFIGNSGAGGGALGDRLTSGTLAVTANSATAVVSLSTNGTTWGYLGSSLSFLPSIASNQVSATSISTTAVQVVSATAPLTCDSGNAGTLRYNSTNTALELCTGTGWQVMGVGIPAGTISAFASTTCPTGWSEYTPARGRFLRGIDNGAGNDPSGTRVSGNVQEDVFKTHSVTISPAATASTGSGTGFIRGGDATGAGFNMTGTASGGAETRPKNVAVTFCQFNGTSNGWNNPLSGGSTVPGGSTGQIQYNTSGSFDASAGLTWDNAASRLTTVNISATALTVNGVPITGSASGDRIVSGSTSAVANPSGTIAVSGTLNVSGAVVGESLTVSTTVNMRNNPSAICVSSTLGAVTQINTKLYFCRL